MFIYTKEVENDSVKEDMQVASLVNLRHELLKLTFKII